MSDPSHQAYPPWIQQSLAVYGWAHHRLHEWTSQCSVDDFKRACKALFKENVRWLSANDSENHWFAIRVPTWTHFLIYLLCVWALCLGLHMAFAKVVSPVMRWVLQSVLRTSFLLCIFYFFWLPTFIAIVQFEDEGPSSGP
jgi:hypothetical protein